MPSVMQPKAHDPNAALRKESKPPNVTSIIYNPWINHDGLTDIHVTPLNSQMVESDEHCISIIKIPN